MLSELLDRFLRWWYKPVPLRVCKVIAFSKDEDVHEYLRWEPEAFEGRWWENHVRLETGFEPERLEIRLLDHGKKRRVVLYPGMYCDTAFPPPVRHRYLIAQLTPRDSTKASPVNVMRRVEKYVGNDLQSAHHMFPFDDWEDNEERFSGVVTMTLDFKVNKLDW